VGVGNNCAVGQAMGVPKNQPICHNSQKQTQQKAGNLGAVLIDGFHKVLTSI
jgi:hypothetical protein